MATKSLICPIGTSEWDIKRAMDETESFAAYQNLPRKDVLHMRLLAEELLGMVGSLLEVQDGTYWIEKAGDGYEFHLKAEAPVGEKAKALLIKASSGNVNAAYKGVKGKIYQVLDAMDQATADAPSPISAGICGIDGVPSVDSSSYIWSMQRFREQQKLDERAAAWDEMELSVLGKLTRDIIVSVRPATVEITLKTR